MSELREKKRAREGDVGEEGVEVAMFELIHQPAERLLSQFAVQFLPSQVGSVPAALQVGSPLYAKKKELCWHHGIGRR